eukprot:TRINITY_DN28577_c0_g1_i1.p1 TRINITY_DN28577_c0_g1~~TRINITY_DN28577_c0_g1_i1.p1  ORF type:complete len:383 (-),score=39.17 TRINITY_DN28577_c0_g1_i1:217-1365(-)
MTMWRQPSWLSTVYFLCAGSEHAGAFRVGAIPVWAEADLASTGQGSASADLLDWEARLAEKSRREWNSYIYVLFTDIHFRAAFENVVAAARDLMAMQPVVIAMDQATAEAFHALRAPVARFAPAPWSGGQLSSQMLRYLLTLRFLLRGLSVLYADVDVFWVRNPLPYFPTKADVAVSAHVYDAEVCSGLFMARPTEAAVSMFQAVVDWIRGHSLWVSNHSDHQLVFDYALRNKPNFRLPNDFITKQDLRPLQALGVRWTFLPLRQFMHYTAPRHVWSPPHLPRLGDPPLPGESPLVGAHLWSSGGPTPGERVALACLIGLWVSKKPPEDPQSGWPPAYSKCNWCKDAWGDYAMGPRWHWCLGFSPNLPNSSLGVVVVTPIVR